ncbi:S41 family peptidase [Caulobacter segnis]|uniref:S41 family peptidase n=1 Tax=Caulobacter segnis TaxID=88688 RepID=UPI0024103A4C|nr:S41 family peptidase [Caulobacter segnis]MDG2520542.1 S41 family peptidase [Caulobacter segnis]
MISLRLAASICMLGSLAGTAALAQQAQPIAVARASVAPLTAAERAAAVAAVITAVEARYVFPDRIAAIRGRLSDSLSSGRYDVTDPQVFAERMTTDLRESSQDRHMYLTHNPGEYAAAVSSKGDVFDNPEVKALWAAAEKRANGGLSEMRILPGNVRYLRITQFHWVTDRTGQAYDGAMRFLRDGDAVIIDLRGNGGGNHAAVRYLLSHFMKPDTLDITFLQAGKEPIQSRTLDHLPAGRLTDKPLYVLTDGTVGSAAEAFAYDVQQFRVGTVVGATTGGAANNNEFAPIAPGFVLSISSGRPVHPVSGGNWERVGVIPDVAVDPAIAFDTAAALALKALLDRGEGAPDDRAAWEWARAGAEARLKPVRVPLKQLRPLAGTYGGRTILFRNDRLIWRLANGQDFPLTPMTADGLFAVEGTNDRMRARLDGKVLEVHRLDAAAPSRFPRD